MSEQREVVHYTEMTEKDRSRMARSVIKATKALGSDHYMSTVDFLAETSTVSPGDIADIRRRVREATDHA